MTLPQVAGFMIGASFLLGCSFGAFSMRLIAWAKEREKAVPPSPPPIAFKGRVPPAVPLPVPMPPRARCEG